MKRSPLLACVTVLLVVLGFLFRNLLVPGEVLASNDAPLGLMQAFNAERWDYFWHGSWANLSWLGTEAVGTMPNISHGSYVLLGAVGFAKFYAPIGLFILGLAAFFFCRRLGFQAWVGVLTAVAAMLNANIFSHACWGLASRATVVASILFALGVLLKPEQGMRRWLQAALAGFGVGFAVMEGADVGAIFSLYAGAAVVFHAINESSDRVRGLVHGIGRLVVVVVCSAWIASYTVSSLVGTQVKGVTGTSQDEATRERQWGFATQWSWPPGESIRFLIPGVYGYRMDTPDGGNYWGSVGAPDGMPQARSSGGGEYAGVLVVLGALWAVGRALAKSSGQPFSPEERRWILFWAASAFVSLLFAFGRFAPFYKLIYALPYFSTIRNPIKFLHPFHMSLVVLFAYGLQGIWRQYMERVVVRKSGLIEQVTHWWSTGKGFDRAVRVAALAVVITGVAGAVLYAGSRTSLVAHLGKVGFGGEAGGLIAGFSIREVWIFAVVLVASVGAFVVAFSGWFSGVRANGAWMLLGGVLVVDMIRSNSPWVMTYDYQIRYQTNPVVDFLKQKPSDARVTAFIDPHRMYMLGNGQAFHYLHNEWLEHHFQFNRIQSLDIIQMPRVPEIDAAYLAALTPPRFAGEAGDQLQQIFAATVQLPYLQSNQVAQVRGFLPLVRTNFSIARRLWQLTNTRWLLGNAGLATVLNEVLDPGARRFKEHFRFEFAPKPALPPDPRWPLQHITAVQTPEGSQAVTEFTGALPRVKFYTQYETVTDDKAHLARLIDPSFDPERAVVTFEKVNATSSPPQTGSGGEATVTSYQGNRIAVKTKSDKPGVLLLNEKWDPHFAVTVNGKPAALLRCNYIMRGVEVPAGENQVEFSFRPSMTSLYVSLVALGVALLLGVVLARPGQKPAGIVPAS